MPVSVVEDQIITLFVIPVMFYLVGKGRGHKISDYFEVSTNYASVLSEYILHSGLRAVRCFKSLSGFSVMSHPHVPTGPVRFLIKL